MTPFRVAFAGAQDTGKTTLAQTMAAYFSTKGFVVHCVTEYARDYILQYGQIRGVAEQLAIVEEQIRREHAVASKAELLFTDAPLYLGYIYTLYHADLMLAKDVSYLNKIFELVMRRPLYELVFYLTPFRKPLEDGVRSTFTLDDNPRLDQMIRGFLDLYRPYYETITEPAMPDRIRHITASIEGRFL